MHIKWQPRIALSCVMSWLTFPWNFSESTLGTLITIEICYCHDRVWNKRIQTLLKQCEKAESKRSKIFLIEDDAIRVHEKYFQNEPNFKILWTEYKQQLYFHRRNCCYWYLPNTSVTQQLTLDKTWLFNIIYLTDNKPFLPLRNFEKIFTKNCSYR